MFIRLTYRSHTRLHHQNNDKTIKSLALIADHVNETGHRFMFSEATILSHAEKDLKEYLKRIDYQTTIVTNIQRLERVQYAAAHSITSQLCPSPLEALTREATLPTMATRYRMLATIQTD